MPPTLRIASVLILASLAACSRAPAGPPAGPTVTLVDSLVVSDPDTFPRRPGPPVIARSGRGDLLIAVEDRVLHFSPDGRFIQVLGTPGEGPHELREVSGIGVLPGDSVVAVVSTGRSRLIRFRLADGAPLGEAVIPTPFRGSAQWIMHGDTVLIPVQDGEGGYRRWVVADDTVRNWGEEPPSRRGGASRAYMTGGNASAGVFGDGVLALVPADSMLLVYAGDGRVARRLLLPVVRRRQLAADAEEQVVAGMRQTPMQFVLPGPLALGLHRLPDGRYLTVHLDAVAEIRQNPFGMVFSDVRYWIGIVSEDLTRACVDALLPDPPQEVIRPIFHGDTIALLVRTLTESGEPRSVLRQYRVTDAGCGWVGMGE